MAKKDSAQRYVAYADLGPNGAPGSFVDPAAFGGEESVDFQYMLEHRSVVPLGDPDAAIVMGSAGAVAAADEAEATKNAELEALRARVKELEDAAATKADTPASDSKPTQASASPGTTSKSTTTK